MLLKLSIGYSGINNFVAYKLPKSRLGERPGEQGGSTVGAHWTD